MTPGDVNLVRLTSELQGAPPVRAEIPAFEAFTMLGALQFAWRNPHLTPLQRAVVEKAGRDLQEAITQRSAYAGAVAELGWHQEYDVPRAAEST